MNNFRELMLGMIGGTIVLNVLLASCAPESSSQTANAPPSAANKLMLNNFYVNSRLNEVELSDFTLKDGTRCVVVSGYKTGAGVTCNWKVAP